MPEGDCLHVFDVDVSTATGLLAGRYAPERYQEFHAEYGEPD